MIYFILEYDRYDNKRKIIYYYRNLDDALCFMINNFAFSKSTNFYRYSVARVDERYQYVRLYKVNPYYTLKYDNKQKKYYLDFNKKKDKNLYTPKFDQRLDLINKLIIIKKKSLYEIYKATEMKNPNKFFCNKYDLINDLFRYSFHHELKFYIDNEKHNFVPLVE